MNTQILADKLAGAVRFFGPEALGRSCDMTRVASSLGFTLSATVGRGYGADDGESQLS